MRAIVLAMFFLRMPPGDAEAAGSAGGCSRVGTVLCDELLAGAALSMPMARRMMPVASAEEISLPAARC